MENSSLIETKWNISPARRILLLLLLALAGLVLCSVFMLFFMAKGDEMTGSVVYASIILQDVLTFIAPAIAAMVLCYYRPLQVMGLAQAPSWKGIVLAALVCAVSLPAMNWLVEWNKGMQLPQALSGLEQWMQAMEQQGEEVTRDMLEHQSVGGLLVNLCVVGFLAGLSEEIFFRGSMLKMFSRSGHISHVAVWVVAIVFSAMHMQFYGFVPRMLLGAWFGYLLWWTRSLWVPIIAHTLNNSLVVIFTWLEDRGVVSGDSVDSLGLAQQGEMPWLALASAVVTIALIVCARRWFFQKNEQ
ncbi:MAG: CPBP family intramembrane metalloprotease [Muribaculaceae bacterium]|nr:CPBP family intramembrane metalloprotease [Muribaculaceae bacterium]